MKLLIGLKSDSTGSERGEESEAIARRRIARGRGSQVNLLDFCDRSWPVEEERGNNSDFVPLIVFHDLVWPLQPLPSRLRRDAEISGNIQWA